MSPERALFLKDERKLRLRLRLKMDKSAGANPAPPTFILFWEGSPTKQRQSNLVLGFRSRLKPG
jgi:hypothetical protein